MNNRKIVFIEPPISLNEIYGGLASVGAVSPPLNLLLLSAIVREKGFEPYIIDSPAWELSYSDVVSKLRNIDAKFVGITSMTPHIIQAGMLIDSIKEHLPYTVIMLGGAHISAVPEETMNRFQNIDVGFIGEADHSLPELLSAINEYKPANSVKGIIFREKGKLVKTGQRTDKISLDSLPLFAWDILDGFPQAYKTPLFAAHRLPATPIITSRGCPGKCIFCFSGFHKTISTYSAEYIINMLKHLKHNYGLKEFMIFDDNFVMFKKNLRNMLNRLIDESLELTWSCNARVDMIDEDLLKLMNHAGCWQISYGIETGNQNIMERLEKKITREKVRKAVAMTRKAGIRTVGYFMIGHFGESLETVEETIRFAKDLKLDDFRMSFFTPLPGTKAVSLADQYGTYETDWRGMNLFSPVFIPQGMSKKQLITLQKKAIRNFFFRPRIIWSYLKMVKHPVTFLKGVYQFAKYVMGIN